MHHPPNPKCGDWTFGHGRKTSNVLTILMEVALLWFSPFLKKNFPIVGDVDACAFFNQLGALPVEQFLA